MYVPFDGIHTPRTCLQGLGPWWGNEGVGTRGMSALVFLPWRGDDNALKDELTQVFWLFGMISFLIITETDALRLSAYTPVLRLIPLLRWHITNQLNRKSLSVPGQLSDCRPQGDVKEDDSRRNVLTTRSRRCTWKVCRTKLRQCRAWMKMQETQNWKELENLGRNLKLVQERCSSEKTHGGNSGKSSWMIIHSTRTRVSDTLNDSSKVELSNAMTIIDEIYGWEDEKKRVGSKFAACMWICTREVLTRGQIPNPEMEEYLKKRMMSIMVCTNWVCAGTFENHQWVSESIITQHVEEVMGMELDAEICIPCVTQWCMLGFAAPTRLNRAFERQDLKIAEYHVRSCQPSY